MELTQTDIILLANMVFPIAASLGFALIRFIESKLPKDQQAKVESIVQTVVAAVEQARPALAGSEKKAEAMHVASMLLGQAKINASPELVSVLIEAAVHAINQNQPQDAGSAPTQVLPKVNAQ